MTILLDHHQMIVRRDRDNVHPIYGVDHEHFVFTAVARWNFAVGTKRKDAKIAQQFGTDLSPGLDHFGFTIFDLRLEFAAKAAA